MNIMPYFFESTLENSGAIWRITLTVHKKVIKSGELATTAPCGSFCHALTITLHFVNWGETSMMVDRLLKSTPDGKLTVFKSWLFGGKMFGSVNCRLSRCKFLCFWPCERKHRPAAVTIWNGHIPSWCRVASLCQAPRHMVSNFPLLHSPSATQQLTP